MKDWSLHVLDILENSAKAGATRVAVVFALDGPRFRFEIRDNGPGFPEAVRPDPTDPFRTSRTERRVGLGLSLLRTAAERTGGSLVVEEAAGGGVRVRTVVDLSHIDAQPLGSLAETLVAAVLAWPALDMLVSVGEPPREMLDTAKVKAELDGLPIGHPEVIGFLRRQMDEALAEVTEAADAATVSGLQG